MQQDNFSNVFLARHVSGTYAHHQEHWMLSCSICYAAYAMQRLSRHHPSKNSVQKTICCNSTFSAPDDGRMYPKHVEQKTVCCNSTSSAPDDGRMYPKHVALRIH